MTQTKPATPDTLLPSSPSSLDLKATNGEWERSACDDPRGHWLDAETGEIVGVAGCRRLTCDACLASRARGLTRAISVIARPQRLVSLTLVPDPLSEWDRLLWQQRDLVRRLRGLGYSWEWAWWVERNPRGTGFHLHGLQHGSYVPQRSLQAARGERIVDIRAIKGRGGVGRAAAYGLKSGIGRVAAYGSKGIESDPSEFRDLNGGRIVHASRGFFRGATLKDAEIQSKGETPDNGRYLLIRKAS